MTGDVQCSLYRVGPGRAAGPPVAVYRFVMSPRSAIVSAQQTVTHRASQVGRRFLNGKSLLLLSVSNFRRSSASWPIVATSVSPSQSVPLMSFPVDLITTSSPMAAAARSDSVPDRPTVSNYATTHARPTVNTLVKATLGWSIGP